MVLRGWFLAAALLLFTSLAAPLPSAELIHQWTFNGFPSDSVGDAHGSLMGGATIEGDRLHVDGTAGTRFLTRPLGRELRAKTLVAWVSLSNTFQKGGSVLTVENNANGDVFDAIVYAERIDGQWMAGSDAFGRTVVDNGGPPETLTEPAIVMMVIVYDADGSITIYRNGELYADPAAASFGALVTFPATSVVQIGSRHGSNPDVLDGWIEETRIYGGELDAGDVLELYETGPETRPNEPPPGPELLHQWTFEDDTANDTVGQAHGQLLGGTTIAEGRLHIDGTPASRMLTGPLGEVVGPRTLISWASLATLSPRPGSILTIEDNANGDVFDGIVFAERVPGQWMAGSNFWQRSVADNGGAPETLIEPEQVMIAIAYADDSTITIYRNGEVYADPTAASAGTLVSYGADSVVQIGARHGPHDDAIEAWIDEARIYSGVLDGDAIRDIHERGPVKAATVFHRGDANADGTLNITDGIFVLNFLFIGGPTPTCMEAANPNDDGALNITDGIYILNFLFLGGPSPTSPGPVDLPCGPDPAGSDLGCDVYGDC